MKREVNTPNIVVDDNYRMLVKRLTRRYAGRGASVYADAEAIEQERSDARARAIAPDAYRISRALGENPEMYKNHSASSSGHMTTDDYLVYFSKCHDTFEAVNYYNLHAESVSAAESEEKPRVLVNRKRMEAYTGAGAKQVDRRKKAAASVDKAIASSEARVRKNATPEAREEKTSWFSSSKRRTFTAFAAAAASIAIVIGGAFAIAPAGDSVPYARAAAEEDAVSPVVEVEAQEFLQNIE